MVMRKLILSIVIITGLIVPVAGQGSADAKANFNTCNRVFRDLIRSIGRMEPAEPKLIISNNPDVIAHTTAQNEVVVGYRLIELCRLQGADSLNSLALVLGHELAHYYQQHFWAKQFGSSFADMTWGKKAKEAFATMSDSMGFYELQADAFGMFYSYIAGYSPLNIASTMYDQIYTTFSREPNLDGYPTLDER